MEEELNKTKSDLLFWIAALPFFAVIVAAVVIPLFPALPLPEQVMQDFPTWKYVTAFLVNNLLLLPGLFAACRYGNKIITRMVFFRAMYLVYGFYCFLVGFVLSFGIGVSLFSLVLVMIYVGITLGAVIALFLSMTAWNFCCKICDADFVPRTGKLITAGLITGALLLTVTYKV